MNRMKYSYIGMKLEDFNKDRLAAEMEGHECPPISSIWTKGENIVVYSLTTGNLSYAYHYLAEKIIRVHFVKDEAEMAGFILANRLGANLENLFNDNSKDSTSTDTTT